MNRDVSFEDEVAAVLDLIEGVVTAQIDLRAFLFRELWPNEQGPVIELSANDSRTQFVGCRLQGLRVGAPDDGIVMSAESDPLLRPTPADDPVVGIVSR